MKKPLLQLLLTLVLTGFISTSIAEGIMVRYRKTVPENLQEGSGNRASEKGFRNQAAQVYCSALNDYLCTSGEHISNVTIATTPLNHTSHCDSNNLVSNYSNFLPSSNTTANLTRNTSYTFSVTASFNAIISIWIDFNANNVFEASEWVQVCTTSVSAVPNTVSFLIPSGAVVGATGMRVRSREATFANGAIDACTDFLSGETEDYVVGIETNVGENEILGLKDLLIYPNPSRGLLTIFSGEKSAGSVVTMYDTFGNLVNASTTENSFRKDLDISGLPNGIYLLRIQNGSQLTTEKIILNK